MTQDPFRSPPGTNPPRHVKETGNGPFIGGAIVVAILLAIGAWAVHNRSATTTVKPPAVTVAPAPDETTGRAAPRLTQ
jgi:hypothetical protein